MKNNIPLSSSLKEMYWLVSADMGYGHQRAIYPLKTLSANGQILNANISPYSTPKEQRLWKKLVRIYEFMSRAASFPVIGGIISKILDSLLYIPKYYPLKNRSNSTLQVKYLKFCINRGLCHGIIEEIKKPTRPIITSFYVPAIASEIAGYKKIYCIICDTDLSRVWVAENASTSKIIYLAPGTESAIRLNTYGVPEKNIIVTGFPLPLELLGNRDLETLKTNLSRRLQNLDPDCRFYNLYKHNINAFIQVEERSMVTKEHKQNSITITYTVGGAGAQKEVGRQIALSLSKKIQDEEVKLNLVAGTRTELRDYFVRVKEEIAGNNKNVRIIWAKDKESYFELFAQCLHTTDILWTKPSELSFYCALGMPIIMTPSIGPQEKFNRIWLSETGAGINQLNPELTHQWLFDLLNTGRLAEAAWLGFLKARKYGTYNILDFLETGSFVPSTNPLKR
jgi:hypothetical protein